MDSLSSNKSAQLLVQYLGKSFGDKKKMEDNESKRVIRQDAIKDMKIVPRRQKKLKLSAEIFDRLSCLLEHDKQIVSLLLTGMTAAVEIRSQVNEVVKNSCALECNKALESLIQTNADYISSKLRRIQRTVVSWHQCAAGTYFFCIQTFMDQECLSIA